MSPRRRKIVSFITQLSAYPRDAKHPLPPQPFPPPPPLPTPAPPPPPSPPSLLRNFYGNFGSGE
ncbi:hypothetical protein E2C01_088863 [Portunus trituberculatus]|uniref:Uncharacterized protein n=1 Tax=Portunus trituberculatus TaxID=210409 RepID=A0A5B7JH79_PORTR|nr:hypothetical protein [Portunus trituberculatus]